MSEQDISVEFDGPVLEPVKGIGDVKFDRATMEYWATWAGALKQKRFNQYKAELDKSPSIAPAEKARALAQAQATAVQLFDVMDNQYTPEGIGKILSDAYVRAGGKAAEWPNIAKRIGPRRQQQLATEICSEPRPTSEELREALRGLLRKAQKAIPPNLDTMGDEELIAAAKQFQPKAESSGESPLSETPGSESEPGLITDSAAT